MVGGTFFATAGGVVFDPLSAEAKSLAHDSARARERLSSIVAQRKEEEKKQNKNNNYDEKDEVDIDDADIPYQETDIEVRRIEDRVRAATLEVAKLEQENQDRKLLARIAAVEKGNTKAIPSQYVYKQDVADNAAKRAMVHHAGSHYHMAGSHQFQKGVRVQGVISRHSKQGAKMQAARMSNRNKNNAMEAARGERAESSGNGKGQGKTGKAKNKKKSDK
jgi:hypothetical protein